MTRLIVQLHPSIKFDNTPREFSGEFSSITLIDAIGQLLKDFSQLYEYCTSDGKRKPGFLYISDGAELSSLGMLDTIIGEEEEIVVKIVPILHGG
ncbi:MAG: MoaD/ThiS family protein [Candidatus Heimdallarchaeota archaeon]|nr:MoaD/ThiS family protein [Candidatus Heimdallarchaeota archaeon]